MAAFPTTIPGVIMDGMGFKPDAGFIRTDMEGGLARQRQRYTQTPTVFNVSWTFTRAQLAEFEKFYDVTIAGGSAWFTIDLVNGMGKTNYTARFKEPYSAQTAAREHYWTVTASLETLSRPLLP